MTLILTDTQKTLVNGTNMEDWLSRCQLVQAAAEAMTNGDNPETALGLICQLAQDKKWEVRKCVADLLPSLPEPESARITALYLADTHRYVRTAAERAQKRRKEVERRQASDRRTRALRQARRIRFEKKYGPDVAQAAEDLADRMFNDMVGAIVHDFKALLTPLRTDAESLLNQLDGAPATTARLQRTFKRYSRRVDVLERLVHDIRDFAQPTPAQWQTEDLGDLTREAIRAVQELFRAERRDVGAVRLNVDLPPNLPVTVAGASIIASITNIVKNAYESHAIAPYLFIDGDVTISARSTSDAVILEIRDNGMGMSAEELDELLTFKPGGTTKKEHGSGFGLPTAQRRIVDHGGVLTIESEDGVGTTVTISLPKETE